MRRPRRLALPFLLCLLFVLVGASVARATLPVVYSFPVGLAAAVADPGGSPPGSNDYSCHPSAAHPYPVVLVHGTFADRRDGWNALSPLLKNNGYCVFALNYGGSSASSLIQATGPVATSAAQLSTFVNGVLTATGAAKVDIVGHSQGGMMPRFYVKSLGGASKVHDLIGLSPSNHGTSLDGLALLARAIPGATGLVGAACASCADQIVGSPFLTGLNAGGDTVAGVNYTVITTIYDEVVTPYTSAFLRGANVTNITVQNQCILDGADHLAINYDHIALNDVLNALDPAHARSTLCTPVVAGIGG